jgi:hypothetical protein
MTFVITKGDNYGTEKNIQDWLLRVRMGDMEHRNWTQSDELLFTLPRSREFIQFDGLEMEPFKV